MHAVKKGRRLENEKFFELKIKEYRDGIKGKETMIGMGYESLHITELLSVQCLQVDDVIPILLPTVYCGIGMCGSQRFTWWHYFLIGV